MFFFPFHSRIIFFPFRSFSMWYSFDMFFSLLLLSRWNDFRFVSQFHFFFYFIWFRFFPTCCNCCFLGDFRKWKKKRTQTTEGGGRVLERRRKMYTSKHIDTYHLKTIHYSHTYTFQMVCGGCVTFFQFNLMLANPKAFERSVLLYNKLQIHD